MQYKKSSLVIIIIIGVAVSLVRCMKEVKAVDSRGTNFAGAASCKTCHQAIYDSFITSAHYTSTSPAIKAIILGNFSEGSNTFKFNDSLTVVMEHRDSGYYQVLYEKGKEKTAYRFDILFGSRNAQTSLYWQENQTFELPVSFYDAGKVWATSPGFSATHPDFKRFIGTDCFECHSSNIKSTLNASTSGITQELVKGSIIYGIDCERCHGPANAHVLYHQQNEKDTVSKYLMLNSSLNRQKKIDGCALCHSGNDKLKIESRFKFKPGDDLDNYFMSKETRGKVSDFDVHGNQYGLLKESKCFKNTSTMTCGTCHDPHKDANQSLAVYSAKCIACHNEQTHSICPELHKKGDIIKANCIDCHMAEQPSKAITFKLPGSLTNSSYFLRSHFIGIPDIGKKKLNKR